ncbi:hypothetical protein ACIBTV_27170 [Micromonospora sp. NPDC049366]|uniref:hypothetical protein n=1 Tax=Micromonospora sp. NPDC049366 TaxID=3364271 RepID=UPI0037A791C6
MGESLRRRFRIVLIAVTLAFALTNLTSYLIGQTVRSEAEQDTRARVGTLEREFATDLDERRKARDAEVARQDAELRQLRKDACTLADRVLPRDAELQELRRRYGCTGDAAPSTDPGRSTAPGPNGGHERPSPDPSRGQPDRPHTPAPVTPEPTPAPTQPPAADPEDGGLICLPLLGCVL